MTAVVFRMCGWVDDNHAFVVYVWPGEGEWNTLLLSISSRSSHDEYTPVSQVDVIQQKLMTMLTSLYKDIHLTELY